jgi:O-antigen/teichoic acid export membrane protein
MVERMLPRMSVLLMPVGVLLATLPDVMVRYTLGPNWVETTPLIAWMSVVIIQAPVFSVGNWILISVGASRALLNFAVVGLVVTAAAALIGVRYGIETMTAVYMLSSLFLRMPSLLVLAHRHAGLPYGGLLRACGIDLALVLGTIAAMLGLRAALAGYGDLIQAAAVCLAIALIYGARILLDPVLRLEALGMLYTIASRLSGRRPV